MIEFGKPEIVLREGAQNRASEAVKLSITVADKSIEFVGVLGDLTQVTTEAIVCPANPGFVFDPLPGVKAAVARAGGTEIFSALERTAEELMKGSDGVDYEGSKRGLPLGYTIATPSGRLDRFRNILHVCNFRYEPGKDPCDEDVVRFCMPRVLSKADGLNLKSITFPALGTGVFGLEMNESIRGTIRGVGDYFESNPQSKIEKVGIAIYAKPSVFNAEDLAQRFSLAIKS